MPITCPFGAQPIRQEEFAELDYRVMRHAFDSQTELGRLCDHHVYRNDLASRLATAGVGAVRTEVSLSVTYQDFRKVYRMDLVLNDAAVYELKAEASLVSEHDAQLLNYLFLLGASRGKLVNFRPVRVQSRFVNNPLTQEARRRIHVDLSRWEESDDRSRLLHEIMIALLEEWGGFLDLALYIEALTYFLGGEERVMQLVPLRRGAIALGNQRVHLLSHDMAFRVTALVDGADSYEPQLRALLRHSPLRAIQWINLAHQKVRFVTLSK
jgi:GxxExxY protein